MVITQEQHDNSKKKKIEVKEKCPEPKQEIKELYGIVPSNSHYGAYYLITGKKDLKCSCPARVECTHLKEIKNGNRACVRITRCIPEKDAEHC